MIKLEILLLQPTVMLILLLYRCPNLFYQSLS